MSDDCCRRMLRLFSCGIEAAAGRVVVELVTGLDESAGTGPPARWAEIRDAGTGLVMSARIEGEHSEPTARAVLDSHDEWIDVTDVDHNVDAFLEIVATWDAGRWAA